MDQIRKEYSDKFLTDEEMENAIYRKMISRIVNLSTMIAVNGRMGTGTHMLVNEKIFNFIFNNTNDTVLENNEFNLMDLLIYSL